VINKLGFLIRFWELKARHATLGEPLGSGEQLELLSLMQLVAGDLRMPEPGMYEAGDLPAQMIGQGTILAVDVRHVSAAAVLVAASRSMALGERVIVRTADAVSGVEYTLPCSVAWVYDASPVMMALVVDGIPTRAELAAMPEAHAAGAVRATQLMSMRRQVRLVG
jgi:hypothetical protein